MGRVPTLITCACASMDRVEDDQDGQQEEEEGDSDR